MYFKEHRIYTNGLVKIATPYYIIFYNGGDDIPDRMDMRLSDAFIYPTESVLIGDSRLCFAEWCLKDQSVSWTAYGGKGIYWFESEVMPIVKGQLDQKKVVISLGLNNINIESGRLDDFLKRYKGILDTFQKENPNTTIYITTIGHLGPAFNGTNWQNNLEYFNG